MKVYHLKLLQNICRLLSDGVNVNTRHPLGWTALQVASINGQLQVVETLLKAGADPDLGDDFSSAQKIALENNMGYQDGNYYLVSFFIVKYILTKTAWKQKIFLVCFRRLQEFSAAINVTASYQGFTALHYAALVNEIYVLRALLNAGANPTKLNAWNHPPSAYSKKECRDIINEYIPKVIV